MDNGYKLIGLTGRKFSGKDTAALPLIARGYQNVKFAEAFKMMLRKLLSYQGVDDETIERMIEGDLKETPTKYLQGRSPRHAMQSIGSEWGRELIGEDLWVDAAMNRASLGHTVISDVRFPNECEAIKRRGGLIIRIKNGGQSDNSDTHSSEQFIDQLPVDHEILNTKETNPKAIERSIALLGQHVLFLAGEE